MTTKWSRKEIINHHRVLFYENIENDFDVFLHTEDDTLIRPTNVLAFMDEMEKLRLLVGNEVSEKVYRFLLSSKMRVCLVCFPQCFIVFLKWNCRLHEC